MKDHRVLGFLQKPKQIEPETVSVLVLRYEVSDREALVLGKLDVRQTVSLLCETSSSFFFLPFDPYLLSHNLNVSKS